MKIDLTAPSALEVWVELFGLARISSGRRLVPITVPVDAETHDVVGALGTVCPHLVGEIILDDLSGLQSSYTLNVNGTSFVSDGPLNLEQGDTILLFSSQAGG
jgi:hypothetical protein